MKRKINTAQSGINMVRFITRTIRKIEKGRMENQEIFEKKKESSAAKFQVGLNQNREIKYEEGKGCNQGEKYIFDDKTLTMVSV